MIFFGSGCNSNDNLLASINGGAAIQVGYIALPSGCAYSTGTLIVPANATYLMTSMHGGIQQWTELR
jgi:hypothetical protein